MDRRRAVVIVALALGLTACAGPRVSPGVPAQLAPSRMALPARLLATPLGLNARIAPIGLLENGEMDVPGTADEVGWYEHGARPGERGNAVLVGHNVWNRQPGAFVGLGRLRVGDRLTVTSSSQASYGYVVESVTSYPASAAPVAEVFGPTADPVLTLITCSGRPDARGEYPDRLVVRARAAP